MPVSEQLFIYTTGKHKRQPQGSQFRIDPKRQTESRLILMRKELNRENPSHYVCREGTETTVIHEDITQWGAQKEMTDTFCLRGRLYMERSDTPTSARGGSTGEICITN